MTGPKCSKNFVRWTYGAHAPGASVGNDLEANCAAAVTAAGDQALGTARHPLNTADLLFGKGSIRVDRRKRRPVYLMTTKTLAESKGDWDYFKLISTIRPEDAWRPLDKGGCPFVKV